MRRSRTVRAFEFGPYASVLPLVIGFFTVAMPDLLPLDPEVVQRAILGYGALNLGFLGGIRWGLALTDRLGDEKVFIYAVIGGCIAAISLVLPFRLGLALLVVGFAGQGAWDVWARPKKTLSERYSDRRTLVTLLMCFSLIATLMVANG